jgi:hypothetical protein
MSLIIKSPTEGSYEPLIRMFKDPNHWSISTMELLQNRILDIIKAKEFVFKVEDDSVLDNNT